MFPLWAAAHQWSKNIVHCRCHHHVLLEVAVLMFSFSFFKHCFLFLIVGHIYIANIVSLLIHSPTDLISALSNKCLFVGGKKHLENKMLDLNIS